MTIKNQTQPELVDRTSKALWVKTTVEAETSNDWFRAAEIAEEQAVEVALSLGHTEGQIDRTGISSQSKTKLGPRSIQYSFTIKVTLA